MFQSDFVPVKVLFSIVAYYIKFTQSMYISAHGIKCYHCDGLEDPATCQETMQCAAGEVILAFYRSERESSFSYLCLTYIYIMSCRFQI